MEGTSDWILGLGVLAGLMLRAWIVASEAAIPALPEEKRRTWAQEGRFLALWLHRLAEDSAIRLQSLRLGLLFLDLVVAGGGTVWLFQRWGLSLWMFFFWLILAWLLNGPWESWPRAFGQRYAEALALPGALTLMPLRWLTWPMRFLAVRLGPRVEGRAVPVIDEAELRTLVDAGEEGGAIEATEKEMIVSIFELHDTVVGEIMVPRPDMVAIPVTASLPEALNVILQAGYSRIPVYEGTIDHIVGVLYAKDLLRLLRDGIREASLKELLRPPYFVPEGKRIVDLLREMQQRKVHMAIVVDEYGGVAGLVTIEDILEEIVGEIQDEFDRSEEPLVLPVDEHTYLFDGRVDLDEVQELLGVSLSVEGADTLAGYVYERLGRIPIAGETFTEEGLEFRVEEVLGRRIRKIRIRRLEPQING
ncbi:hemolysin family protein [Thermoflexus sp.]|uniref:hemolysin family protein n=2 Tax=Thermoflexus sp. TaxID=1969742 RepID=UPI0025F9DE05|nr:hemolysin family protein [Thermoflexus sp.]MCS7351410.1 hemolysin family protein [Thermoflexus sp.]MCX7691299.1 hemolysin family protein [Thermoflexus sp.]MDW8180866.1 hemolysin family protein [Anaerolineae bacterium]